MKKTVKKDLATKSIDELMGLIAKENEEISRAKLYRKVKKVKNTREIFMKRKTVAVIKTIIREKELQNV